MQPDAISPHKILKRIRTFNIEPSVHFKTILLNPHQIL